MKYIITIAYILANKGIDVIDCGVPVLSMHAPYEVTSKFDIYNAYEVYKAFEEVYEIYHIDINPYLLTEVRRLNKNTESAMKRCFSSTHYLMGDEIITRIFLMILISFLFVALVMPFIKKLAFHIGALDVPRSEEGHNQQ